MSSDGNLLLYVLSAWKETRWPAFKKAFDQVYLLGLRGSGDANEPTRYARFRAARLLDALGHCDLLFDSTGEGMVYVAPPTLAALPIPGLPRAVLCGSRSPDTIALLLRARTQAGGRIRVSEQPAGDGTALAPSRIEIQGQTHDALARFARDLGLVYAYPAPAWAICKLTRPLSDYLASLQWQPQPDINWERWDFDPQMERFAKGSSGLPAQLRLSRYADPSRPRLIHRLWRRSECADVDPLWGRFAVLSSAGKQILAYDETNGNLAVPESVPLPRLLARALTLCSGVAPKPEDVTPSLSSGGKGRRTVYRGVPPDVLRTVAGKLAQTAQVSDQGTKA
jgi:hypothetical protein